MTGPAIQDLFERHRKSRDRKQGPFTVQNSTKLVPDSCFYPDPIFFQRVSLLVFVIVAARKFGHLTAIDEILIVIRISELARNC